MQSPKAEDEKEVTFDQQKEVTNKIELDESHGEETIASPDQTKQKFRKNWSKTTAKIIEMLRTQKRGVIEEEGEVTPIQPSKVILSYLRAQVPEFEHIN